jgi:hypothetical protein
MEREGSEKELIEEPELPLRDERGRFLRSGNPLGKPKGAISKFARLREDFLKAYRKMGGVQGLLSWAREHPSEFYMMIFKMLPKTDFPLDTETAPLSYEERLKLVWSGSSQGQDEEEED